MKIEKIKKSHKKEIVIGGLILVSVVSAITLVTTRAKYKVTQNIKLVNGTVNYKPYDFKIMAMYQQNDSGDYTEITGRMPGSGYVINESKSYCTLDNMNKDISAKLYTYQGKYVIENLAKSDKCYIWFDKKVSIDSAGELLAKMQTEAKTTTPNFTQLATTDEGVYAVEDGMYGGTSYYWRGAATNNYIMFADKCWRIIRINGDGSIRLIYDGTTCHANGESTTDSLAVVSQKYNTNSNDSSYVGWLYTAGSQRHTNNAIASDAKIQTESWFNSKNNFTDPQRAQVVSGKFCNDRNTGPGGSTTEWSATGTAFYYYAAYNRLNIDYSPTLSCESGDVYSLKIGVITADEVEFAGGKNANNKSYYLYNGQNYWTMSPYRWYGSNAYVFYVSNNGYLSSSTHVTATLGLRPVINLKSDTTFSSGNGTQSNPYVVS